MKYFVIGSLLTAYLSIFHSFSVAQTTQESSVMQGFPPTRESQATMENYRQHPISQWTFSNAGAPLNVVMDSITNRYQIRMRSSGGK